LKEQQDDMAKQAKRKSAQQHQKEATLGKGNVITLPLTRVENAEVALQRESMRVEVSKPESTKVETARESPRESQRVESKPEQRPSMREPQFEVRPTRESYETSRSEPVRSEPGAEARSSARAPNVELREPKLDAEKFDAAGDKQSVPGRPRAGRRNRRASSLPPAPLMTALTSSRPESATATVEVRGSVREPSMDRVSGTGTTDPAPKGSLPMVKVTAPTAPLPRVDAATAQESASARGEARDAHDEHAEVQRFFAQPAQHASRDTDGDLFDHEHDHDHDHGHGSKRGMHITAAIGLVGALLIGGFLIYHKLLMPTPEEIAPAPMALPTPDMLRGAPAIEPTPEPAQVAPAIQEPAAVAPAVEEPGPAPVAEEPAPAEAAPSAALPAEAAPTEPAIEQPVMPEAYTKELKAARGAGFKRSAEQAYLKALAIAPQGSEALSGLAMYYLNQGKNQKAKERAEEAVKVDPQSSEGWIVLGASLSALGDSAGARKAYQQCATFEGKYMGECKRMLR
jgi:hypothetical protein